jgi:hypothetical protein
MTGTRAKPSRPTPAALIFDATRWHPLMAAREQR